MYRYNFIYIRVVVLFMYYVFYFFIIFFGFLDFGCSYKSEYYNIYYLDLLNIFISVYNRV